MNQNLSIKSWAEDDRPREKMLLKGRNSLSDSELIAILLGSGSRDKSAVELAQEILACNSNDLSVFSKCSFTDLIKFKGIGEAKAITLLAALELGKRRKDVETPKKLKITRSNDIYTLLIDKFFELKHEEFYVVLVNRANEIIHTEQISKGGLSGTVCDGKIIFKIALDHLANAIVLCHNHPSGQLSPSNEDLLLTTKMISFGKMIDLPILDHLIFTDNGYFSFADEGLMNEK